MSDSKKDTNTEEKMLEEQTLREQPEYAMVSCAACLKEVPKSLAHTHTEEAEDYVRYFCGLECFDKWEHQNNNNKTKPDTP